MKKLIISLALSLTVLCCSCTFYNTDYIKGTTSTFYYMSLELTEDMTLNASQKIEFTNTTQKQIPYLCLQLYANAFSEKCANAPYLESEISSAFPNDVNYGGITIHNVTVNGETQAVEYLKNDIILKIGYAIAPHNTVTIEISYTVDIPETNMRFGYNDKGVNIANFYPQLCVFNDDYYFCDYLPIGDPFYSECANYKVVLIAPKDYKIASTGSQFNEKIDNEKSTFTFYAQNVRDFAFVCSKDYQIISKRQGKTDIFYYYYNDKNPQESLKLGIDSINTFSELFGEYPYDSFTLAQVDFVAGGMEYPNLVYLSSRLSGDIYEKVIIHETAHQWWYGLVGSNQIAQPYLDEGLTELSVALFYKKNNIEKYNSFVLDAITSYKKYSDIYNKVLGETPLLNKQCTEYKKNSDYYYNAYVKAFLMFHSLYEIIGEDSFLLSLKEYKKSYSYKNAEIADFVSILDKNSSLDITYIVNMWLVGNVPLIMPY